MTPRDDLVETLGLDAGRAADKTKRSAKAFKFGLRAGNLTSFIPLSLSVCLKQAENSGSLSMISAIEKEAVETVRQIATNLLYPFLVRLSRDAGDLYLPRLQANHEKNLVANDSRELL